MFYIFERLRKSPKYAETPVSQENMDVVLDDIVEAIVRQHEMELDAGVQLIREYWGMEPKIMDSFDSKYRSPIITMKVGKGNVFINQYVKAVRRKY